MNTVIRSSARLTKAEHCHWLACLLMLSAGCGGVDGPARYRVSGEVRYEGQLVPAGEIVFRPNTNKGNDGPGSVARIRDGRYETEPGRGVVGGAYVVEIVGFDGVPSPESLDGSVLFSPQTEELEFPLATTTRDFDLP